jgi:glycosyltransferase involved in cell wall biosynthesis
MSLGKTVISTTIGAEGINAEHGKEIILADTPDSFAKAIIQMQNNDATREIGLHARTLIENKHSYNNTLNAFNQLLDFDFKQTQ